MSDKKNLWVFGDSFSVPFKMVENEHPYVPYKGYCPKIFSEIISEKLNLNLMDCSRGGCSNYDILHTFIKNVDLIKNNDTIIFGWTQPMRFRIASKKNNFYDVIIAVVDQMKEFIDVPSQSLIDITLNRSNNSIYYDELCDFIKVIKLLKSNCKIVNWTWVEPTFNDEFENKFYNLLIPYVKYPSIDKETNGDVRDFHYGELAHSLFSVDLINYMDYLGFGKKLL